MKDRQGIVSARHKEGPFLLRDTMVGHAAAFNVTRALLLECARCYIHPFYPLFFLLLLPKFLLIIFYKGIVCVSTLYNCEKRYILFSSFPHFRGLLLIRPVCDPSSPFNPRRLHHCSSTDLLALDFYPLAHASLYRD